MKTLLLALSSLVATTLFAADSPPVGAAAPDFSLPDASGKIAQPFRIQRQVRGAGMVQSRMPVCEKALWQRQHAKVAGRIYRQRRGLADDRFQRARIRGEPVAGTSAKGDEGLEARSKPRFCLIPKAKPGALITRAIRRTCSSSIPKAKSFTKARSTAKLRRIQPTFRVPPTT